MPWGMSRGIGDRVMEGVPDLNGPESPVLIWSSPERVLSVDGHHSRKQSHVVLRERVLQKEFSSLS